MVLYKQFSLLSFNVHDLVKIEKMLYKIKIKKNIFLRNKFLSEVQFIFTQKLKPIFFHKKMIISQKQTNFLQTKSFAGEKSFL